MKMLPLLFLCLFAFTGFAQEVDLADPFRPVDLVKELPGRAFLLEEGTDEIDVKDNRIRRITIGSDGKSLTVLFDNKTGKPYGPSLSIWIVDRFGLPVKECWILWSFDRVGAGETHSLDETFAPATTDDALQFTSVRVPEGSGVPKYLVIQYKE